MAERSQHPDADELVITRTFDAPRDLVFRAWTESPHLAHWWGPKGFKMVSCRMDLRPGGIFHYGMESPAGHMMWGKFIFREIVPPEKLQFVVSFSDADGGITRHPLSPTWPLEMLNTIEFSDQGHKTKLTMRAIPIHENDDELQTFRKAREGVQGGFKATMDQLEMYLADQLK